MLLKAYKAFVWIPSPLTNLSKTLCIAKNARNETLFPSIKSNFLFFDIYSPIKPKLTTSILTNTELL